MATWVELRNTMNFQNWELWELGVASSHLEGMAKAGLEGSDYLQQLVSDSQTRHDYPRVLMAEVEHFLTNLMSDMLLDSNTTIGVVRTKSLHQRMSAITQDTQEYDRQCLRVSQFHNFAERIARRRKVKKNQMEEMADFLSSWGSAYKEAAAEARDQQEKICQEQIIVIPWKESLQRILSENEEYGDCLDSASRRQMRARILAPFQRQRKLPDGERLKQLKLDL